MTQTIDRQIAHPLFMKDWDPTKGFYDIVVSLLTTLHAVAQSSSSPPPQQLPVQYEHGGGGMPQSLQAQAFHQEGSTFHVIEEEHMMEETPCEAATGAAIVDGTWRGW